MKRKSYKKPKYPKLNIGCGWNKLDGFVNLGKKIAQDEILGVIRDYTPEEEVETLKKVMGIK